MPQSSMVNAVSGRMTRRSTRLLSSTSSEGNNFEKSSPSKAKTKSTTNVSSVSTKRKLSAISNEGTRPSRSTRPRGESTTNETPTEALSLETTVSNNDIALPSLEIENVDRKTLQTLAKQYGIRANQKSDILRTELGRIAKGESHQPPPITLKTEDHPAVKEELASPKPKQSPIQVKTETVATVKGNVVSPSPKKSPAKKKRSPKKASPKLENVKPPEGWFEIYKLVEELRADRSAPVDTDGSEALPERQHGPKTYRFQVLIALMLSSQTKDAVVGETMRRLQEHGLTVENIHHNTTPSKLNELIRKVGFHNNKTKYIKKVVEILLEKYDGDIPLTAEEMIELPGIGPKMAYIIENVAWNKTTGIGIDTHMHRMFNQLKWVKSKQPEQTRKQLEAWLPKEYWSSVNLLWVGFGQEVQQFKPKMLRKALDSSRPKDALKLVNRLGLDYRKEGEKLGLKEEITAALKK